MRSITTFSIDAVSDFEVTGVNDHADILDVSVAWTLADGTECFQSVRLPTTAVVCPRCGGRGKHDHPAFSNGITQSEWDEWHEDEQDAYRAGAYDVTCSECRGHRVTWDIDFEACAPGSLAHATALLYLARQQEAAQDAADEAFTRRMERGGY